MKFIEIYFCKSDEEQESILNNEENKEFAAARCFHVQKRMTTNYNTPFFTVSPI